MRSYLQVHVYFPSSRHLHSRCLIPYTGWDELNKLASCPCIFLYWVDLSIITFDNQAANVLVFIAQLVEHCSSQTQRPYVRIPLKPRNFSPVNSQLLTLLLQLWRSYKFIWSLSCCPGYRLGTARRQSSGNLHERQQNGCVKADHTAKKVRCSWKGFKWELDKIFDTPDWKNVVAWKV